MNRVCQHCGQLIVGNAYRVTSEEDGIALLIWLFAPSVLWRRKDFGSIRRKSTLEANTFQRGTEGVTVRDSEFNCGPVGLNLGKHNDERRLSNQKSTPWSI